MEKIKNIKSSLLGESYDYWQNIKQPQEMGMYPGHSLKALANNVDGLLSYVEVLISGTGPASATGKPLGNKFFLKTTGKCSATTIEKWKMERDAEKAWEEAYKAVDEKLDNQEITKNQATKLKNALNEEKKKRNANNDKKKKKVPRYMYVNNIPDGTIPFIASGADGRGFSSLKGLIPGALGNLGALNPIGLFKGFTAGTYPDCAKITLETVDKDNISSTKTHYVALIDIVELNPCGLPGRVNPATGVKCKVPESFNSMTEQHPIGNISGEVVSSGAAKENPNYIYELGSLAGSSGVAYQTSHRSPLSYNMEKSTGKTELSYDVFNRNGDKVKQTVMNAREVMAKHNANSSSFYDNPIPQSSSFASDTDEINEEDANEGGNSTIGTIGTIYNNILQYLYSLLEPSNNTNSEDLSTLRGDTLSQVYYYSMTAILLYLFYRILYKKRR
jgi:hypothetical protein